MKPILASALVLSLFSAPVSAATTCADLQQKLKATYGFRPSQLDEAALNAKSAQMDEVWETVQANAKTLAPCLKAALQRPAQDSWFLFDGSQLLLSVDPSDDTKRIFLDALKQVPLDDVDLRTWVAGASSLGEQGFDTAVLARRWLEYPKAGYYLPEHGAYHVDRQNGAMFIIGAMDERFATPVLTELAKTSTGETKEIAVMMLMSQATPEALKALAELDPAGLSETSVRSRNALLTGPELIEPRKEPKTTRKEFTDAFAALLAGDDAPFDALIEAVPDGERDLVAVTTPADLDVLRKVRRHYAAKNTQHAIEYYNQFTTILMTLVWKPR